MAGPLSASLGRLSDLRRLDLNENALSGPIPAALGDLGRLELLSFAANDFSGPIPAELGGLGRLEVLNLSANDLSGPIPAELGNLGSLAQITLAGNDLSGPIPAELGSLSALVVLSLSANDLSGLIPAGLGDMASLSALFLGHNPLSWPPPENLVSPREGLSVSLPQAHEWAPAAPGGVAAAARVDALDVSWSAPAAAAPVAGSYRVGIRRAGAAGGFAVLEVASGRSVRVGGLVGGVSYEVVVSAVNHAGEGPASEAVTAVALESPCGVASVVDQSKPALVADCEALWDQRRALVDAAALVNARSGAWGDTVAVGDWVGVTVAGDRVSGLDLSGVEIGGPLAAELGGLSMLSELDLSGNSLSGPVPAQLGSLSMLSELDLSGNSLSGPVPAQLGSLSMLSELDLSFNDLSGPVPSQLGSLSRLQTLDLAGNDLTGSIPAQLGSLAQLRVLRVSGAGLTGSIPTQLGSLTNLTELHIDGGGLTGAIPTQLGSLTSLTSLHLGGAFTGAIPAQLGNLTSLTSLYVSAPDLSGALPAELGALTSLETLWIKSVSLTGTIPARYASLTGLDTLYLSGGGLTGAVPAWISSITGLERLYLHNNRLDGAIPAAVADHAALSTVWLANNNLTGTIPAALGAQSALVVLDLRRNPLTWPPPTALTSPRDGLAVLLPDTAAWAPPPPTNVTAEPANGTLTVTWDHPGAGTDYVVDAYTVNYRAATATTPHTQQAATASPATIEGLTNGTAYHIFVTATNTSATSNPSTTIEATPASSSAARGPGGFTDTNATSAHAAAITELAATNTGTLGRHGIFTRTLCNLAQLRLCPNNPVKRWTMAVWLTRALLGEEPPIQAEPFTDVGNVWWRRHVAYFAAEGISRGCTTTAFCPNNSVTRAQMATFLVRAFNIPPAGPAGFTDITGNAHAANIDALAAARITEGCSTRPLKFCPDRSTTRAQMATFISRACSRYPNQCDPPDTGPGGPQRPTGPLPPAAIAVQSSSTRLVLSWERPRPGTPADSWDIRYTRVTRGVLEDTAHERSTVTVAAGVRQVAVIVDLRVDSHYDIEIRGTSGTLGSASYLTGNWSSPKTRARTDPSRVQLIALEVTQGLQNWQGDIELVEGKRTVVRAFFETVDNDPSTAPLLVSAKLYVVAGDGTEHGPIPAQNPTGRIWAQPDAEPRRDSLQTSLNFILSDTTYTKANIDTYKIKVLGEGAYCREQRAPARTCEASVDFVHVDTPRVALVPIAINNDKPTPQQLKEQADRIASLMPIPELDYIIKELDIELDFRPDPSDIHNSLGIARGLDSDTRIYLGILPGQPPSTIQGSSDGVPAVVASWYIETTNTVGSVAVASSRDSLLYARTTGAHEFGHTLGARHASYLDGEEFYVICAELNDRKVQDSVSEEYPYKHDETQDDDSTRVVAPLYFADAGEQQEMWGLDTRFVAENLDSRRLDPQTRDALAVLNPTEVYAIMSYCQGKVEAKFKWVDAHYHGVFIDLVDGIDWSQGPEPPDGLFWEFFSGTRVAPVQPGAAALTRLNPTVRLQPTSVPAEPTAVGDYELELLDGSGTVLESVRFAASVAVDQGGAGDSESWVVAVKDPPEYASYRIKRRSEVIASVQRSAAAPTVAVSSPAQGAVLDGDSVEFSWTGGDPDGDTLSYTVQYSIDAGANYQTIATGHDATTLSRARSSLAGSTRARIRVIASDGARSVTAQSPVFAVAQNAPAVFIESPADAALVAGEQTLTLSAAAYDPEDGLLEGSAVSWSSSLDGALGTGPRLQLAASDLTEGAHTVTATATDSADATASATVTVTIQRLNAGPSAAPDAAYASAGGAAARLDVLANDTDPDDGIAASTLAVIAPASLGTATVAHGAGRAVDYGPAAAGYDAFVYRVCDSFGNCATAQATVTVLEDL